MSEMLHISRILGPPPTIPEGPNQLGGLTPHHVLSPKAYPLFLARKQCRQCGRPYSGWSLKPQRDDDAVHYGFDEVCINAIEAQERLAKPPAPIRRTGARAAGVPDDEPPF